MYTITQLAKEINIPESSARNYRDKFPEYFQSFKDGRLKKYGEDSLKSLKIIRESFENNLTESDIYRVLQDEIGPVVEIHEEIHEEIKENDTAEVPQVYRNQVPQEVVNEFSLENIFKAMEYFTKKEPLSVNLKEAAKMLGISKNAMKELSKRENFPMIKINSRNILIPVEALKAWILEESTKVKGD